MVRKPDSSGGKPEPNHLLPQKRAHFHFEISCVAPPDMIICDLHHHYNPVVPDVSEIMCTDFAGGHFPIPKYFCG